MRRYHILPQPDDEACGQTALQSVYAYHGLDIPLEQVLREVPTLEQGGTLSVMLGIHALSHGLHARLYSYNLRVFDPSWADLDRAALRARLIDQTRYKRSRKLRVACEAYARFLDLGGTLAFDELGPSLLHRYLDRGLPMVTGLSATYLYRSRREYTDRRGHLVTDDLRGEPTGHFVVLIGMNGERVRVADPLQDNPFGTERIYEERVERVVNAILLGVMTYDANLLVLAGSPL